MRSFLQHVVLALGLLVFLSDGQAQADELHRWPVSHLGVFDYSTRESAPFVHLQPPRPEANVWTSPGMIRFYIICGLLLMAAKK